MQQPTRLISTPFAQEGEKTEIQNVTGEFDNSATYRLGFPPITMQSIRSGGKPPKGTDFNGVLFDITENISFLCKGGRYQYNAGLSTLIGGYPEGSNLLLDDNVTEVVSTVGGNKNNPNTNMAGWILKPNKTTAVNVADASGETQQQVNYNGGSKWHSRVGGYKLNERVVLTNGDIVKSTVNGNTNNPNVNMNGWVNQNKDLKDTVNKIAPLDTISTDVDATPFLQSLINAMPDGMTLDLLGKTFTVKKNTGFQSLYPNNDQPCLIVYNKKNIKITNGKLKTDKHGQGIIDFINCPNWLLDGVELEGFGNNFPPLDGTTGRAEKTGSSTQGYYYSADGVLPRNNSVDTSSRTQGGYGGAFPQFTGGTASTWGTWGGGFICNVGHGVYQEDSYGQVTHCKIHGFNGSGIYGKNYKSMISLYNEIYDCYIAGIESYGLNDIAKTPEMYLSAFNKIYNIGHPNASISNTTIDPGYGITTGNSNTGFGRPKVYMTQGNSIFNCKRKGIDAHSSDVIIAKDNIIDGTGYGIASVTNIGSNPKRVEITGNTVSNIQFSESDSAHGIQVRGINTLIGTAIISNNKVTNIGRPSTALSTAPNGRGIYIDNMLIGTVIGNTVDNDTNFVGAIGIANSVNASARCPNFKASSNTVKGAFQFGLFIYGPDSAMTDTKLNKGIYSLTGNTVHLYDFTPFYPSLNYYCMSGLSTARASGNSFYLDEYTKGLYINDDPSRAPMLGESIRLEFTKASGAWTMAVVNQSGGLQVRASDISYSFSFNSLVINVPAFYPRIMNARGLMLSVLRNATPNYVNVINPTVSVKQLGLALYSITGASSTNVDWSGLVDGAKVAAILEF